MANKTAFLQFILPGLGEYRDTWHVPTNSNFSKLDSWASGIDTEIVEARFTLPTLKQFLQVAHNTDGTLKPTAEVATARNSAVYGDQDSTQHDWSLAQRIDAIDREIWKARESEASLAAALAFRAAVFPGMIVSGAADVNGYPAWMGRTGANVNIDGSGTMLQFLMAGKRAALRVLKSLTISGASGTYYIHATPQTDGEIIVDGNTAVTPPAVATGVTSIDSNAKPRIFVDAAQNFVTAGVKVGDMLRIYDTVEKGDYYIAEVGVDADPTKLRIIGLFPKGGISTINYAIFDPFRPAFTFSSSATPPSGGLCIGEADFDLSAVTAVRPRHFKDTFVGAWHDVDVTSTDMAEYWDHNLGTDVVDVSIQVTQVGTAQPVEELSLCALKSTLAVGITDTIAVTKTGDVTFTQGQFVPNASGAVHGADVFTNTLAVGRTGSVTGSLTGSVDPARSALAKWDRNRIWVKNAVSALLYRDYNGTERKTGRVRVVVQKKG